MTLSYGNRKLLDGEIESAIKEFKHALKIFPNSLEATVGLAKSYVLDCETNQSNCEKAKKLLDALIEKYPENYEYISYRFSLEQTLSAQFYKAFQNIVMRWSKKTGQKKMINFII